MLKKSLTSDVTIVFDLFTQLHANLLDIVVIFTTFLTLMGTWFYWHFNKMMYTDALGQILAINYIMFLLCATVVAIDRAYFWENTF